MTLQDFWESEAKRPGLSCVSPDEPLVSTQRIYDYFGRRFAFEGATVLDVGCGICRLLESVCLNGSPSHYVGIDWSRNMLRKGLECSSSQEVVASLVQTDITQGIPFRDKSFDYIILWTVLVHILDDDAFELILAEANRLVKRRVIVCDPTCEDDVVPKISTVYPTKKRRKGDYLSCLSDGAAVSMDNVIFGTDGHHESERTVFCFDYDLR